MQFQFGSAYPMLLRLHNFQMSALVFLCIVLFYTSLLIFQYLRVAAEQKNLLKMLVAGYDEAKSAKALVVDQELLNWKMSQPLVRNGFPQTGNLE